MSRHLREVSIQYIKGVGPARKKLFQKLGIENVEDLLYFFPRRYEDRTQLVPISQVKLHEYQTICGKVLDRAGRRSWYTKKHVYEVAIDDGSGRIFCVWFNQPYLENYFKPGRMVVLYGKVEVYKDRMQMIAPEYELIEKEEDQALSTGRIVPIYPLTRGMTQRYLRKVVRNCLDRYLPEIPDVLPVPIRNKYRLSNIRRSLENIHYPENLQEQDNSHRRISFEEFFFFQISVIKRRMSIVQKPGIAHRIDLDLVRKFSQAFPFKLTASQLRVINEIAADLQKPSPMLRLLQGDVGAGKTLVAFFGCVVAFQNGRQSAIMAPTEILARQHFDVIEQIIRGSVFKDMRVALLAGSMRKEEKQSLYEGLKNKEIDVLVGTHALLSDEVDFASLSYVVIDEQHKFGVRQRALLSAKGTNPDILVMTATPIPRTLSMTLFGDLDVSVIDELPAGRQKAVTKLFSREKEQDAYQLVRETVTKGQQVFFVFPIIEESEKLDLKAAQSSFAHFQKHEFKGLRLGLVHGQLNRQETEEVMEKFKQHQIDILVATTILEVGVDVPNANCMVIEHAERFGLSQLHQLRGRIGRGTDKGLCLLIADPVTEDSQARLEAVLKTSDGFEIAEKDLLIRGPGHYFGRHQHGLNELRFANPVTEIDILQTARKEAEEMIHLDPELSQPAHLAVKAVIHERYPNYLAMAEAA